MAGVWRSVSIVRALPMSRDRRPNRTAGNDGGIGTIGRDRGDIFSSPAHSARIPAFPTQNFQFTRLDNQDLINFYKAQL